MRVLQLIVFSLIAINLVKSDCDSDVQAYFDGLNPTNPQLWSLQMLDSSTKFVFPDGIQQLSYLVQLANFEECVALSGPKDAAGNVRFTGQYCYFSPGFQLLERVTQHVSKKEEAKFQSALTISEKLMSYRIPRLPTKTANQTVELSTLWAVCAPSSCGPEGVKKVADFNLQFFASGLGVQANSSILPSTCYYADDESRSLDTASWIFISFTLVLCMLMFWATLNDIWKTLNLKCMAGWPQGILMAFSLKSNIQDLFKAPAKRLPGHLGCVNGIRALSLFWIIISHTYTANVIPPFINVNLFIEKITKQWYMALILNGYVAVDSFFLLGGLFTTYVPLTDHAKGRKFNIFKYYVYRYLRITVPLAFMTWYLSTVHIYLGNGPLWPINVGAEKKRCAENWWANLMYISNYFHEHCMGQAWYLCVDMQLALLSPLIIFPMIKWPRYGLAALAVTTFGCVAALFAVTYIENLPWTAVLVDTTGNTARFFEVLYENTPLRATPYLCGMGLGYLMAQKKQVKLPKWAIFLGWICSIGILNFVVFGVLIPYREDYTHDPVVAAFYASLHRFAWGLGLSWIIWACVNNYGGFVDRFLSWRHFSTISKLSFSAFLTHLSLIVAVQATRRTPNYLSNFESLYLNSGYLIVIVPYTLFLHLAVEVPLMRVLRLAFGKTTASIEKKPSND